MMKDTPPPPIYTPRLKPAKRHLTATSSSFPSLGPHVPSGAPLWSWGLGFPSAMGLTMTESDSKRGSSLGPQVPSVFINLKEFLLGC